MAPHLGTPLRSLTGTPESSMKRRQPTCFEARLKELELMEKRSEEERARQRTLKARLRRALSGASQAVTAAGRRLSFRLRNATPYPRACAAPAAAPPARPPTPLPLLPLDALRDRRRKLEAEEADLLQLLRELWRLVALGEHMQPALCEPARLAHVVGLLLSGRVADADADFDNDDVLHAAILQAHSARLEAALAEVQAGLQALAAERRRRGRLQQQQQQQEQQEQPQQQERQVGMGCDAAAAPAPAPAPAQSPSGAEAEAEAAAVAPARKLPCVSSGAAEPPHRSCPGSAPSSSSAASHPHAPRPCCHAMPAPPSSPAPPCAPPPASPCPAPASAPWESAPVVAGRTPALSADGCAESCCAGLRRSANSAPALEFGSWAGAVGATGEGALGSSTSCVGGIDGRGAEPCSGGGDGGGCAGLPAGGGGGGGDAVACGAAVHAYCVVQVEGRGGPLRVRS